MRIDKFNEEAALIDEYLSVVAEIKSRKRKKTTPDERKEYLKRLLTPLKVNSKFYLRNDGTYDFIDERIWIRKEIGKFIYDEEKYSIRFENDEPLDPSKRNICIYEDLKNYLDEKARIEKARISYITQLEKEGAIVPTSLRCPPPSYIGEGMTSIRDLYEKWLPILTPEVITSKDLLNQILVCFTIKRAQNGDVQAIDKLCSLYEDTAIGIAYKMAKTYKLLNHIEDIKQEAKILLRQIISGFSPSDIVDRLIDGKRVGTWIEKLYYWYYSEYVPEQIQKLMEHPSQFSFPREQYKYKELNAVLERRSHESGKRYMGIWDLPSEVLNGLAIGVYLNVYTPIRYDTFFKSNSGNRLNRKFNSSSFRPNNKTNLTAWLFGKKEKPRKGITSGYMNGKFFQHLKSIFYLLSKKQNNENLDDIIEGRSEDRDLIDLKVKREVVKKVVEISERKKYENNNENIIKAIRILVSNGMPKRNAEIFVRNKLQGISQKTLAKEYQLSRVQINRICQEVKTHLP